MRIKTIPVGPLETNCYLVYDAESKDAVIVDPGFEADNIKAEVEALDLKVRAILNTHGHYDHVGANDELRLIFKVPLYIHHEDEILFLDPKHLKATFAQNPKPQKEADHYLSDGQSLQFGNLHFDVIHTPGHTQGGVCFVNKMAKICLCGDTLFKGTVGRTDFWGGSYEELLVSIRERLKDLQDDIELYPGHGPSTTIGYERRHNPYFRAVR